MIKKSLITLMYEAASIQRWNDHIRPWTGFTELDKQAHKMFYAYVLAKCEGESVDMIRLIEGGIFEFFHRIVMTDIKPPIYHKLVKEKGYQIDRWVLSQLEDGMRALGGGFFERMERYYAEPEYAELEKKILKAAHYHASNWEFKIIYPMNTETFGIEQVKREMAQGLAACDTFSGFRYFAGSEYLQQFLSLIGKLRYQQRWSKAERMPQTFVMGHMLVVAILSYFLTLELNNPCRKRLENNFFAGLFHDLPEVLTRDIVSPVKNSVKGLDSIISEIEDEQMREIIYPLLPPEWHREIEYYTQNEFDSKVKTEDEILMVTTDIINDRYNGDSFNPIDGQLIRCADHLSAYIEAYMSLNYGIRSEQMVLGYDHLKEKYSNKVVGGLDIGQLFDYFEL
ncbi:MAG: HD domain-containing protein [Clostridia bacterium]|nr:HD domain-containing protein [Clostridia bacterium]MBR0028229.1 HD domain-containing protein [Clostridia bacterium]